VITLRLAPSDLAHLRFAVSPLWECVALMWSVQRSPEAAAGIPWVGRVIRDAGKLHAPLLRAMVDRRRPYLVDFLAPPPLQAENTISVELETMRRSPVNVVLRELRRAGLIVTAAMLPGVLRDLEAELKRVWMSALSHAWPRVRAVLDGDIIVRGRLLAREGAATVLSALHPSITVAGTSLVRIADRRSGKGFGRGRGIVMVPSVFSWPELFVVHSQPWRLTIAYPARAIAAESGGGSVSDVGGALLGRTRARILLATRGGATNGEIASRLGLSAGAVSQQVAQLRMAGVVASNRVGKYVVHDLTERGAAVLALLLAD
jgi:DNA-binding transcriptional ArsR family regulator